MKWKNATPLITLNLTPQISVIIRMKTRESSDSMRNSISQKLIEVEGSEKITKLSFGGGKKKITWGSNLEFLETFPV